MGATVFCSPSCDKQPCPTDGPAGTTVKPVCSDSVVSPGQVPDGQLCFLVCDSSSDCPKGATCAQGTCSYSKNNKIFVV